MTQFEILMPLRGVAQGTAHDPAIPMTSEYMNNVRPRDTLSTRLRIGQRPGLDKRYDQQVGTPNDPIASMVSVTTTDTARNSTLTGAGTAGDPYQIFDIYDLQAAGSFLSAYFKLMNDIDATSTSVWNGGLGFVPIGSAATPFTGDFDGQNYSVFNLTCLRPTNLRVGLFGDCDAATVYDLQVTNANISGAKSGIMVGYADNASSFTDCYTSGTITPDNSGGAPNDSGGFAGFATTSATFTRCGAAATIVINEAVVFNDTGGFIGGAAVVTFTDCYSLTDLTYTAGTITNAGGFNGNSNASAVFTRCWAAGDVLGGLSEADIGGFSGVATGTYNDCFWDTVTSGQASDVGSATGKNTTEMQTQGTYTNYDFNTVWEIAASSYPNLQAVTVFSQVGFTTPRTDIKQLVVAGNNTAYLESETGHVLNVVAGATLVTADPLDMTEGFQKAFIVNETNLKVMDPKSVKITTVAIGTNKPDLGTILTGGTSGAQMVVQYVHVTNFSGAPDGAATIYGYPLVAETSFEAETVTGTNDAGDVISFTGTAEVLGPHFYDWTTWLDDTATYGTMPSRATLVCLYRGRLVMAGNTDDPFNWYMTKVGDPFDLNISDTTAIAAVKGNSADAGLLGDMVRALIPYKDDYLIFGCSNSIWLLRGDPASEGSIDKLQDVDGLFDRDSWVYDIDGNLYMFTMSGIIRMTPDFQIEHLTKLNLPNFVKDLNLDRDTHQVSLGYDPELHGLCIAVTNTSAKTNENYWYDLTANGFFPESYPADISVTSLFTYKAEDQDYRKLLVAGMDGYIRWFDPDSKDDDVGASNQAINSYVLMPVIPMSEDIDHEGKMTSLTIVTAGGASSGAYGDTDSVSYDIYTNDAAETLVEDVKDGASSLFSGTLTGTGRQKRVRDKARGVYLGVKLSNSTDTETWAIEKISGNAQNAGRL